jgi:glucose-1-phosphate adenylyltransferase
MRAGMENVTAIVLGGGRGTRLYPLTVRRAKPAVGFAGKYRIIDIPVSNCINSGIKRIFVLTQFLSASLHRHIMRTYRFDEFTDGFIDILAAEQTVQREDWFQGPADAVRVTLDHTMYYQSDEIVVLSGDQLYRLDFGDVIRRHRESKADITICVHPVSREEAKRMGLVGLDKSLHVKGFVEKPQEDEVIDSFRTPEGVFVGHTSHTDDTFVGSMGIYVFRPTILHELLTGSDAVDFGYGIFQSALSFCKVVAYPFSRYWQDIGTIPAFFKAHMALVRPDPPFQLYAPRWPIYTRGRSLPPTCVIGSEIRDSLLAEGSIITNSRVIDSIVGVRSVIGSGSTLRQVVLLGQDFYDGEQLLTDTEKGDIPPMGIGRDCFIERAIIDKNVRIGDNVIIRNRQDIREYQSEEYWIREGIAVIPKGAVIPSGTII